MSVFVDGVVSVIVRRTDTFEFNTATHVVCDEVMAPGDLFSPLQSTEGQEHYPKRPWFDGTARLARSLSPPETTTQSCATQASWRPRDSL
jgi:hypothetical protein